MVDRGLAIKAGLVLLLVVGVGGAATVYTVAQDFEQPRLESMQNEFGTVTNETTEIRSNIVVQNPNDRSLPGGATVAYTVSMNGVTVADGSKNGISIESGRNEITLSTEMDNAKIPAWWVTHVNAGEQTTLRTQPSVRVAGVVDRDLPAQEQQIETNLLGSFEGQEPRTIVVANESILRTSKQRAEWGEADSERTPIMVTTDVENVHDEPIKLDGTEYRVEMNGVVVGEGSTNDSIHLEPGESGTFTARPAIDTPKMQEWWASHVRNNETTRLSVQVYGVVEDGDETKRVPLSIYRQEARIETAMLDGGETTIEQLSVEEASFASPELVDRSSEYGEITDAETEILTEVTVENPNERDAGDVVTLNLRQRTLINGVEAASGEGSVEGLDAGNNTFTQSSALDHDAVPAWWAGHLNNGEESVTVTRTEATADVGVTRLDVAVPDDEGTLTTDLLADFTSTEDQAVEENGETVIVIKETRASWGHATPDRAPIDTAITVENRQFQSVTISDITYRVELNGVALADNRSVGESYTIPPSSTRTIEPTFELDNRKMAEWWPTHARNGESSVLTTRVYVTVESPIGTTTRELDSFGGNQTVTTNVVAD